MNSNLINMVESIMLVIALSIDAFVVSFAYGSGKIKIPILSVFMIDLVCTFTLALSLFFGKIIKLFIPDNITKLICFLILFTIGIVKLFDSRLKLYMRKHKKVHKTMSFSFMNLNFIFDMYANPEKADIDTSKILSPLESIPLAIALSLDGLAVGLGAALTGINFLQVVIFSLVINIIVVSVGFFIGNKVAEKASIDLSWLSGLILIVLSIVKYYDII